MICDFVRFVLSRIVRVTGAIMRHGQYVLADESPPERRSIRRVAGDGRRRGRHGRR